MRSEVGTQARLTKVRGFWFIIVVTAVLSGFFGAAGALLLSPSLQPAPAEPCMVSTPAIPISYDIQSGITDVVAHIGPAVVTVINHLPPRQTFFGGRIEQSSSGSGVIISDDGIIVTNNHVVDGAQSLDVVYADGTTEPAKLIGVDSYVDLAVIQVEGEVPAVAAWGNSDSLKPGETVIAIGSPLGAFMNTVTAGVISATDRSLGTGQTYQLEGLLQTDAAINQGNSGGPLINLAGQIIGINTVIVRSSGSGAIAEGLGFAIPSNTARAVSDQIMQQGYVSRPYLGADWVWITPETALRYGLPVEYGLFITHVLQGGPADAAGIRRGDIIVAMNGQKLDANHPFINMLFSFDPGSQVTLDVVRGSDLLPIPVILGESPGL